MQRGVLIGCGFFGRIQMESWQRVTGGEITAAVDLDPAKVQSFANDFGLKAYTSVDEALDAEKPTFVDIATRPFTHRDLTANAAQRGLAVLCQKPIAEGWDEACQVIDAARKPGVRIMINENWRWQRWYREIRKLLDAGKIGDPYFYSMQTRNQDGVGENLFPNQPYFVEMPRFLIWETLVHHMDAASYLFGPIEEVYCRPMRVNERVRAEDAAIVVMRHTGGLNGVIDGNRAGEPDGPGPAMEVCRFEGLDGTIRLSHSGDVRLGQETVYSAAGLPGYRGDSCWATQQHFTDCLNSGEEFETEGLRYLNSTFAAVEACYRSGQENRPVRISEFQHKTDRQ